jgi:hypothetical protein
MINNQLLLSLTKNFKYLFNILKPKWFSVFLALTPILSRGRGRRYSLSLWEKVRVRAFG